MVEAFSNLVKDKKIEGINDLRDESDRSGIRVVIELKRDAYPKKVLNRLYKLTQLQETFHVNMVALVDGLQPRVLNLKTMLEEYIKHREAVVTRRSQFELKKAQDRAHILEGLVIALEKIDAIIKTIKASKNKEEAKINLMKQFKFSERQTIAILDMRLQQLANLERLQVEEELKEQQKIIRELKRILSSRKNILTVVKDEVIELKNKYGDDRRTEIVPQALGNFSQEDLIPKESAIVMLTRDGYIKRLTPDTFKQQHRGGKGIIGLTAKEEDSAAALISTNTHSNLLFFTSKGRVFQLRSYEVPAASRTAKGQAIVNFLQLGPEEQVNAVLPVEKSSQNKYFVMVTRNGLIKKTKLDAFANVRRSGLIALKLKIGDQLQWVKPSSGKDHIILTSNNGQAIRFKETDVRDMGRNAAGVRGIRLKASDLVVGMEILPAGDAKNQQLTVVMSQGFGKRSDLKSYKVQNRGGSGIKTAKITPKTGQIVYSFLTDSSPIHDILMISKAGQVIRLPLKSVSVSGRATQGVRLMRFKIEKDKIASIAVLATQLAE